MTEYKIKVPKAYSPFNNYTSFITNYGNIIYIIWKEENNGPIKEIDNTVDIINHEYVHLIIRKIAGLQASFQLDDITGFDSQKQRCFYNVGGCRRTCPTY